MTLEVRVLAAEFASVMGVSFRNLAGTVAKDVPSFGNIIGLIQSP
jgi:hypothetical protein